MTYIVLWATAPGGRATSRPGGSPARPSVPATYVLVFNYNKEKHNVAWVSKRGYRRCEVSPRGARDRVMLPRGTHYFICAMPGHCAAGMKLAVNAY
ncbi:hypothetical protein EJB05_45310 [Eragrostis curvula]|uniref:Phytocyanin domain-containing protein n=1 Tax=Eragrostis curvula TaxID=38414 RepID=A0A5J9TL94_9POAL|nr:hypothetical protein EJB05_45310 [Eragrostis curvula]